MHVCFLLLVTTTDTPFPGNETTFVGSDNGDVNGKFNMFFSFC